MLSVILSVKVSVGVAAYRAALAPVQPKASSAISRSPGRQRGRAPPAGRPEVRQICPHLGAAVEPAPLPPQRARQ